jgi:hypothetical protein
MGHVVTVDDKLAVLRDLLLEVRADLRELRASVENIEAAIFEMAEREDRQREMSAP